MITAYRIQGCIGRFCSFTQHFDKSQVGLKSTMVEEYSRMFIVPCVLAHKQLMNFRRLSFQYYQKLEPSKKYLGYTKSLVVKLRLVAQVLSNIFSETDVFDILLMNLKNSHAK